MHLAPRSTAAAVLAAAALAGAPRGARAGDYHVGATLVCADCHTMHASLGHGLDGTPAPGPPVAPAPGGPQTYLLKAAGNDLCLACHDGRTDAPDVYGDQALASVRAAGGLNRTGDTGAWAEGNGHTLGSGDVAPGGTWRAPAGLACIDCHDKHGNGSYRNLRPDRGGAAGAAQVDVTYAVGGPGPASTMAVEAQAPLGDPATHYAAGNVRYGTAGGKTLSDWCAGCHASVHGAPGNLPVGGSPVGDTPSLAGDEWLEHPTGGVTMGAARTNGRVDATHWWLTSGAGAPRSRVPVVAPGGAVPADDNQPFCGSCHKAHGSTHRGGLIYDDDRTTTPEDGARPLDTCQQCHFK
jgi:predicted CXXCH cytochrome family protein